MLGLITGTALHEFLPEPRETHCRNTPYGAPSAPIGVIELGGKDVFALARHGLEGQTAAHKVNYRANIYFLKEVGVSSIIATATVGGIDRSLSAGDFVVPDQIIDYTYGRKQTFVGNTPITHFDFTSPFDTRLRNALLKSLPSKNRSLEFQSGTYAVTQGPRFETAAEIEKYRNDGCSLVGMTLMPEAALARELEIKYAALCLVVNPAAGVDSDEIDIPDTAVVTRNSLSSLKESVVSAIKLLH